MCDQGMSTEPKQGMSTEPTHNSDVSMDDDDITLLESIPGCSKDSGKRLRKSVTPYTPEKKRPRTKDEARKNEVFLEEIMQVLVKDMENEVDEKEDDEWVPDDGDVQPNPLNDDDPDDEDFCTKKIYKKKKKGRPSSKKLI